MRARTSEDVCGLELPLLAGVLLRCRSQLSFCQVSDLTLKKRGQVLGGRCVIYLGDDSIEYLERRHIGMMPYGEAGGRSGVPAPSVGAMEIAAAKAVCSDGWLLRVRPGWSECDIDIRKVFLGIDGRVDGEVEGTTEGGGEGVGHVVAHLAAQRVPRAAFAHDNNQKKNKKNKEITKMRERESQRATVGGTERETM